MPQKFSGRLFTDARNAGQFPAQTIRIAVPYLFAASGGALAERAGIVSLSLEGYMLGGAFCGALASYYSGSAWVALIGAIAGGVALALLYGVTAVRFRADQVVVPAGSVVACTWPVPS